MRGEAFDVAVVGAGFGGLAAAIALAERGAKVALFEQLRYPGGCASTFTRGGYRFESGATLSAGLGDGQLFARWLARYGVALATRVPDPMVELRTAAWTLPIGARPGDLAARLAAMPGAPRAALDAFFAEQGRIAATLWELFDDPSLLPPFGLRAIGRHAARAARYAPILRWIGRPLAAVVAAHGLAGFEPLRVFLDAVSQITVQASSAEAEAPFALATMDYSVRGARHVHGGVGALAEALLGVARSLGVDARTADGVQRIAEVPGGFRVASRRGAVAARAVVANLVPRALEALLGGHAPELREAARRVDDGWGAAMLYLALAGDAPLRPEAHHLELVADAGAPFVEGNHVFCSLSGADEARGPRGERTVTVSTHVPIAKLLAMSDAERGAYVARVQAAMDRTIAARAPEVAGAVVHRSTASPRTFARFVGRPGGHVGGVPRRAGLDNYRGLVPSPVRRGLWMVGDSVFPGQSTLATAIGGVKVAEAIARDL